ncbi:phosphotransferase [Candidatus Bipolaricaulota bacterium]|nr:phosphotransferase [Candidatus Bipolaricaulota bacterium]
MKLLCELTQIGRGRRLRPVARALLSEYGITPTQLKQITEASNTIFRVFTGSGEGYVLRMTAPKSCHGADEIRSEVAWLNAIDRDTSLGIPAPIARLDGEYVSEVLLPGEPKPIGCAVYRWVPGAMLDDALTQDNVRRLGVLMAQLHVHAAGFVPPEGFHIRTFDSVFPYSAEGFAGSEPVILFDKDSPCPLTDKQRDVYQQAMECVSQEVDQLMGNKAPLRVIHNDLHVWNVKVDGERIYALDFEDLMWGHPIQDIATTLYYVRWRDTYDEMLAAFRSGYQSVLAWPEGHAGQLETLIMGRALILANYAVVSEDAEDRAFAPEYLERIQERLQGYLDTLKQN